METEAKREVIVQQFMQREKGILHPTYDTELSFYEMVSDGRLEELKEKTDYSDVDMEARGILSRNALRNLKYHIIVTIVMVSRFCIEKGMEEQESYGLSDYYIRLLDTMEGEQDLKKLHKTLVFDYATRMKQLKRVKKYSLHCIRGMDYIHNHLHEAIRLETIASYVNLEKTYFSKLFHREVGCRVSEYILNEKVKVAKNMLAYSEYTCTEIAEYLAFSSDSYFGKIFRERTGETPMQYRKNHYRRHWVLEN